LDCGFQAAKDEREKAATQVMIDRSNAEPAVAKPSLPLNEYAGVYNDAWYGPATIRLENAGLVFTLDHTPKAIADLQIGNTTPSRPTGATTPLKTPS